MADPGDQPLEPSQLGDYRLVEVLAESAATRTYRAEQISISRAVVLERLKDEARGDAEAVARFLADVRAKAAVDHPGIESIYEAVDDEEAVYYTREFLDGYPFQELRDAEVCFTPAVMAIFLRQIGSAMESLEQRGFAKLPLEARHLVLGEHEVVRLSNVVVAQREEAGRPGHDRQLVAELCLDLLQRGVAGATRTRTLLTMMAERDGTGLTWTQVAHTARQLSQELSEGAMVASQAIKTGRIRDSRAGRRRGRLMLGLLIGLPVLGALVVGGLLLTNRKPPPPARDLSAMVKVPGGLYLTHEGKAVELAPFWIDAYEVSIGEYAGFLEMLAGLPAEQRARHDHADQPAFKLDHIPDDWESIISAARIGGTVEGLEFDLNYPIGGIDWWDAHAYAHWKGGRLPNQAEFYAASQGSEVKPAERGPVDQLPGDLTARGIHGLAGNVSEWVRDPEKNPAFPMNAKKPLCCGASYLAPRGGPRVRAWLPSRETRRRDVGFRTVRERAP